MLILIGLKWGEKNTLPKLVDEFNAAASKIRINGDFMGVQKVKFGIKGSKQTAKLVDANVYNCEINGKIYYYWETLSGKFISTGLKIK